MNAIEKTSAGAVSGRCRGRVSWAMATSRSSTGPLDAPVHLDVRPRVDAAVMPKVLPQHAVLQQVCRVGAAAGAAPVRAVALQPGLGRGQQPDRSADGERGLQ